MSRRGPRKTEPALRFGARTLAPEARRALRLPPPLSKVPAPPDFVAANPIALAEWERAAPMLNELGLLTVLSLGHFEIYVMTVADVIREHRTTGKFNISLMRVLRLYASDLRMSPSSQGFPPRLVPGPDIQGGARDETNRFTKFGRR